MKSIVRLAAAAVAALVSLSAFADPKALPPSGRGSWSFASNNLAGGRFTTAAVALADGRVLVSGAGAGVTTQLEIFDPSTNSFSVVANDGFTRGEHTLTRLTDGRVLLASGWDNGMTRSTRAHLFDPADNSVTETGSLTLGRNYAAATLLADSRVLVCGGNTASGISASCEIFDPADGTWSDGGSLLHARVSFTATLLPNGKVLIAGGTAATAVVEIYDPASKTSTAGPAMDVPRSFQTATTLADGRVALIGGFVSAPAATASVQIYDPASGLLTSGGTLPAPRAGHAAAVLADGRILIAGGSPFGEEAAIYDPAAANSSLTASMRTQRYSPAAATLPDGRVVLISGAATVATAELFAPAGLGMARGDLTRDGKADLVWRNYAPGGGEARIWQMNGLAASHIATLPGWGFDTVVVPDLGGGAGGILFREPGNTATDLLFQLPGSSFWNTAKLGNAGAPAGFHAIAGRDADGDGRADIFWRNATTGALRVSLFERISDIPYFRVRESYALPGVGEFGWIVGAIDDFDGDGKADILWRHTIRGENYVWYLDRENVIGGAQTVPVPDQNFQIAGTGDFNGDGKADLVWRNDNSGETVLWLMNGVGANGSPIPTLPAAWRLASIADVNGDGKSDLVWRNTLTGQNGIWMMDTFTVIMSGGIPSVTDPNWSVLAP